MSRLPERLLGNHNSTAAEQLTRDLFDRREPIYPAFPRARAPAAKRRKQSRRPYQLGARLFADLHPRGLTADEAVKELNASPFLIRPRLSELSAAGLIEKKGERRRNPNSSLNAAVWRAGGLLRSSPSIVPGSGA